MNAFMDIHECIYGLPEWLENGYLLLEKICTFTKKYMIIIKLYGYIFMDSQKGIY